MDPITYPYDVETNGAVYTVLDPDATTYHRVRLPDGQVTGVPGDSTDVLTADALASWIANPPVAPVPVPDSVPAWRLHAVAEIAGLTAAIEAFIAALPYAANIVASKAWSQGNVIERHSVTVEALITAGIVTADSADDLFRQAASLTV